jgi:hypothetical protein
MIIRSIPSGVVILWQLISLEAYLSTLELFTMAT